MQKAKSDAKKEKLHVTLIAQNNVVLQSQIIQNWCILAQGNYLLKEKSEQFEETMTTKLCYGRGGLDREGPSLLGKPRGSFGHHLISLCELSVCREFTTTAEIIVDLPGCIFRCFRYT